MYKIIPSCRIPYSKQKNAPSSYRYDRVPVPSRRRMDYTHAYERYDTLFNYRQGSFFS